MDEIGTSDRVRNVISSRMRRGETTPVPGFGHPLYPDGDPRAPILLNMLMEHYPDSPSIALSRTVIDTVQEMLGDYPTIDFALATLGRTYELQAGCTLGIFALGRMIYKLTPEQEAQIPIYAEKWRQIQLSTKPANRPEVEKVIQQIYSTGGLKPPKSIVWFDSPVAMYSSHYPIEELLRKMTLFATLVFDAERDMVSWIHLRVIKFKIYVKALFQFSGW